MLVDVSIDQGGCFETSRPTTHSDPTYEVDGVTHYCVANMPGAVPITSTYALTNATLPYVLHVADAGVARAARENPGLAKGVNVVGGKVTYAPVAEATGQPYTSCSRRSARGLSDGASCAATSVGSRRSRRCVTRSTRQPAASSGRVRRAVVLEACAAAVRGPAVGLDRDRRSGQAKSSRRRPIAVSARLREAGRATSRGSAPRSRCRPATSTGAAPAGRCWRAPPDERVGQPVSSVRGVVTGMPACVRRPVRVLGGR